jgi:hypothetical protein
MYKGKPVVLLRGRGLTDRALGIPWKSEHVGGENPRRRGSDGFWRLRQWCYLTGGVRDTISDVKWRSWKSQQDGRSKQILSGRDVGIMGYIRNMYVVFLGRLVSSRWVQRYEVVRTPSA